MKLLGETKWRSEPTDDDEESGDELWLGVKNSRTEL